MDLTKIKKAYHRYAPVYDVVFGKVFAEGRRLAVNKLASLGPGPVLEIGVGTGLSLPFYPEGVEVTGIDISPQMLNKARKRAERHELRSVRLQEMDAQELQYPDNSFNGVAAMYVASVIPDPVRMMDEAFRVCRPGGIILVVNHFSSRNKRLRAFEKFLTPLSDRLGFHPDFCMDQFLDNIGRKPREVHKVNMGGYWRLLEFHKPD
ncbi:MAG: class I SAM-dependent methyltransferase [Verrucomicrobia bacterium]|nr:class I SAM-dependent methyltransferase [Verrucomicrobiota bacterium]